MSYTNTSIKSAEELGTVPGRPWPLISLATASTQTSQWTENNFDIMPGLPCTIPPLEPNAAMSTIPYTLATESASCQVLYGSVMSLGVEKEGGKGGTLGDENEGGILDPGCFAFSRKFRNP